jgi:hypothetical protein
MKAILPVSGLLVAGLAAFPVSAASAQDEDAAIFASPRSQTRIEQQTITIAPAPVPRIRIFGAPRTQPNQSVTIECSPVEEELAGVIVGPNNLCGN